MARRWDRPENLPYIFGAQVVASGLLALEGTRRALGGDYQFYTGFSGGKPRPDSTRLDRYFRGSTSLPNSSPTDRMPKRQRMDDSDSLLSGAEDARAGGYSVPSMRALPAPLQAALPAPSSASSQAALPAPEPSAAAKVAGGAGTGGREEDGLKPIHHIPLILPDYYTFRGRSIVRHRWTGPAYNTSTGVPDSLTDLSGNVYELWMNVPYDVNKNTTGTSNINTTISGYGLWKTYYKYYNVVGTRVKVTFKRNNRQFTEKKALDDVLINRNAALYVGFIADPGNLISIGSKDYTNWVGRPHSHFELICDGETQSFVYNYNFDKWDTDIAQVQQDGIWTLIDNAPSTKDVLKICVFPTDLETQGHMDIFIEVEQVVQMRQWNATTLSDIIYKTTAVPADVT